MRPGSVVVLRSVTVLLCMAACGEVSLLPDAGGSGGDSGGDEAVDAGPVRCGPLTCAGCCSNNVCRTGEEQLACGYSGRACRECDSRTQCVSPGTCASIAGDAETAPPFNPDAGTLINPFTGGPMQPPSQECIFIFGGYFCG